jgi:hypothetical protein
MRRRVAVSLPEKGSVATSASSCSTVHGGEVRSRGEIGRRTRGGGAHREAAVVAMVAQLAARSGQGEHAGVDERSTVRGALVFRWGCSSSKNRGTEKEGATVAIDAL